MKARVSSFEFSAEKRKNENENRKTENLKSYSEYYQ